MLWIDDDFVTLNDLMSIDAEITDISQTENITVTGNTGIIRRAKEDAQANLSRFMSFSGLSQTDLTVRNVNMPLGTPDLRYNYAGFAQLVVTGDANDNWSALKRWAVANALRKFYNAATNKNKDRYSDRFDSMNEQIRTEFWPNFKRRGLPMCFNPLDAPGAIMNRCGRFSSSNLSLVAGTGTQTVSYDYAITWVGSKYTSPTVKNNNESYRSNRVSLVMTNGNVARVSIAGLTAPNGNQPDFTKSSCRYSPGVAVGWNVWACKTPDPTQQSTLGSDYDYPVMYRQNVAAGVIPLATTSFTLPSDPVLSGEVLDFGQFDDVVLEMRSELQRC